MASSIQSISPKYVDVPLSVGIDAAVKIIITLYNDRSGNGSGKSLYGTRVGHTRKGGVNKSGAEDNGK